MVIPQGMSYAQNLAFLPQVYGEFPIIFHRCLRLLDGGRPAAVGVEVPQ
jgi:hypothetical protein